MNGQHTPASFTLADLHAMAKFGAVLEELAKTQGDHCLSGHVRVHNCDGWSPGYFEFEDALVIFYADYQEDEA